jgi:hypothetical protein
MSTSARVSYDAAQQMAVTSERMRSANERIAERRADADERERGRKVLRESAPAHGPRPAPRPSDER